MPWFPLQINDDAVSWRFDIVGLLAVVGGSAIRKNSLAMTASWLGSFPRLLPAPETMLDPDRPRRLQLPGTNDVTVIRVHSGLQFTELDLFASSIHRVESLDPLQFQCFRVTYRRKDEEDNYAPRANIPLYTFCPLNLLTVASIVITVALFVWAGIEGDAVALLGLGTMSLSTSMACLSTQWKPNIPVRRVGAHVPDGDVVIKTRFGAFITVKCPEEIARELYSGKYSYFYTFGERVHQYLLAMSTVFLMAAIIFFSNCGWKIQIAVGLAYIVLNLAHWALALLTKPNENFNLGVRYNIEVLEDKVNENYTQLLWDAIRITGSIEWVKKTGSAPQTKHWDGWLEEAKENFQNLNWDPEEALDRWMRMKLEEPSSDMEEKMIPNMAASRNHTGGCRKNMTNGAKRRNKWRAYQAGYSRGRLKEAGNDP